MGILFYMIFYFGLMCLCITLTESLDVWTSENFKKRYKIPDSRVSIHSRYHTFSVAFRNDVIQVIAWSVLSIFYFDKYTTDISNSPFVIRHAIHLFWNLACFFVFDLIMYYGHIWMHSTKRWRSMHQEHHETFATSGLSSHFMSFPDFIIESIGIVIVYIVILIPLGCPLVPILQFLSYGIYNTIFVHSGWDFSFTPDPRPHYLHHLRYRVNYGIGLFDRIYSTELDWKDASTISGSSTY
jgi:sterol desaturase/sphingolipid hydroxylase (fatty acid hydroxylase superfamily)